MEDRTDRPLPRGEEGERKRVGEDPLEGGEGGNRGKRTRKTQTGDRGRGVCPSAKDQVSLCLGEDR